MISEQKKFSLRISSEKKRVMGAILLIVAIPIVAIATGKLMNRNVINEKIGLLGFWGIPETYQVPRVGSWGKLKDRNTYVFLPSETASASNQKARCYVLEMVASYDEKDPIEKNIGYNLIDINDTNKEDCLTYTKRAELTRE